ncbi:MAG: hypothetical protein KC457_36655, partial [Myxococcales bacterium]|nr:hypothetical protein [Myxococcales bacterium]
MFPGAPAVVLELVIGPRAQPTGLVAQVELAGDHVDQRGLGAEIDVVLPDLAEGDPVLLAKVAIDQVLARSLGDQDLDADRDDVNEQTAVEPGAAGALEFDYDAWTIEQLLQATLPAGSERFDLRDELGHGGMGSVFMAVDRGLHRPVALKQLDEARATSVSQVANFLREARISARIDHPNLVPVHELGVR